MPTNKKKSNFYESPAGIKSREELLEMMADPKFKTKAYYSANTTLHPNNKMTFVEKHMDYLSNHQSMDPDHYLSNLRLMTRVK